MKSYIDQEVIGNSTIKDATNKFSNGRRLSQESSNKTNYDMNVYFKLNLMRDMQNDKWKSKKEIRKMLHPTLEDQYLPNQDSVMSGLKTHMDTIFFPK